jgi:tRNA1Val (adenine37-N6)-methyltransferase
MLSKQSTRLPNSYFQFKQFTVLQDLNPMKVCTDSCLFGAWVPLPQYGRLLDIGTGTGLLALMAAQRTNALVDAVELQPDAAREATSNVNLSPWKHRIVIHQGNILDYTLPVYRTRYDVIICNPPFFPNHLKSKDVGDVTARHDIELPLNKLLFAIEKLLNDTGSAFLLLPYEPFKKVESIVDGTALNVAQAVAVKNMPGKPPIRWMIELKRNAVQTKFDEMFIYNADNSYTDRFVDLLKPYYLYL